MDEWQKWKKTEPARIASYVNEVEAYRWFGIPDSDQALRLNEPLVLVRRLYDHLLTKEIRYDTARIDFVGHHEAEQVVREPGEVRNEGGNCLELALVFAALCQRLRLYPIVVLLEGHALVAVRLDEDVERVMATGRPGARDFEVLRQGLLPAARDRHEIAATLVEWVSDGRCVFVECTGFTSSPGALSFDDAVAKGLDLIRAGRLANLVDVSFLHRARLHRPYTPRNAAAPTTDICLGRAAIDATQSQLTRIGAPPPQTWNVQGLQALRAATNDDRLQAMLDDLDRALRTTAFVRDWMRGALTTRRLRVALIEAGIGSIPAPPADYGDYLEHVALHHASTDEHAGSALVAFVTSVAYDAGLDVRDPDFDAWAESVLDSVRVNEVRDRAVRRRQSARWRLLLGLSGSPTGQWPESVDAWLLDGDEVRDKAVEPCAPTQQSVEGAIGELLDWAAEMLAGDVLQRVDIAVPTSLLARWRPEETSVGSRLGLHHDVVVRWSERLNPPAHLRFALREAAARWDVIQHKGGVDWLELAQTRDIEAVVDDMRNGRYAGGVGLRFLPERDDKLLELLLAFSPVLLWPDDNTCSWDGVERELSLHWIALPAALAHAYRNRWTSDVGAPLAVVRAVWDDQDWLAFCRKARRSAGIAR